MQLMLSRTSLAAAAIALATFVTPNLANAQKTETIEGGRTTVTLANSFVATLGDLGVTPGTVAPTNLKNGTVDFPVTGGAIDLVTAAGQILHSGGLTLTAGGTEVTLQSFIIDTTSTTPGAPVITGLVSVGGTLGGRLPLFNIVLPSRFSLPLKPEYGELRLKGVGLTLTSTAAGALNGVYHLTGSSAIPAGLPIGTANVTLLLSYCDDHEE